MPSTQTTTLQTKPAARSAAIGSSTILPMADEVTNNFILAEFENKSGSTDGKNNHHVLDCAKVAKGLLASYPNGESWSFQDFLVFARHLDLKFSDMQEFFAKWTKALEKSGRCEKILGCYDHIVYRLI